MPRKLSQSEKFALSEVNGDSDVYSSYEKPVQLPLTQRLQNYLYNAETGEIMGRTSGSWGRIGVFYLVFYSVLAAMSGVLMWAFLQTLDPRTPRWLLDESLIGTNPGIGFRPIPVESDVGSSLIWYKASDRSNYQYWIDSLIKFLDVYKRPGLTPGRGQNIYNCDYDRPPGRGQVCDVDVKLFDPCTEENHFNYHKSGPCLFLKLNKVYGWIPEYYNDTQNLPRGMPGQLRNYIENVARTNPKQLNTVWVSCEGENPADIENLGDIKYYPKQGFAGYFFPYENSEGYLSPLVAINIPRPRTGILINIKCKAWAKNIKHLRDGSGSVHFEIMVD
ncbi:sodium/potassium-transporting ATPase subunit beta-2-like isoform X2 [Diaphorina citri]|uniref:Sodium/potassium-transporting ATPase subunit beta-2-like isoform X2 n=2 Tax=Diaphorina citri TaxID=121845 RepID=A0A1S3DBF9_DIACI|nr:sodium/potassium-transporting ATPase subunit beta-2-like isoform X3 [Diaphorina citri]XP_026683217.1 sodium/potassium-transporting ATPase subunit beta-2-like isoform X2 [Diaphorina citri]KAI5742566.1 hypothetical protein M8J77_008675 [Diaphorina citri]